MKKLTLALGGAVGLAALWSAGWFAGKTLYVEPEADRAIEQLRQGELFFSYDTRSVAGFPFAYDVTYEAIELSDASGLWRWTAPSMAIGSGVADAGALTLAPAARSKLIVEARAFGGAADAPPAVFDVTADDLTLRMSGSRAGPVDGPDGTPANGAAFDLSAKSAIAEQAAGGGPLSDGLLRFAALSMTGDLSGDGATGEGRLTADEMELGYRISLDGVSEMFTSGVTKGVDLSFSGAALDSEDMTAFLNRGGEAEAKFAAASYEGISGSSGGPSQPPLSVAMTGGASAADISVRDGRARYAAKAEALDYSVEMQPPAPLTEGAATMKRFEMSFDMPVKRAPEPEAYTLAIAIEDLAADDALWALADPGAAIARTPLSLDLDLGGLMRILVDLGGGAGGGQSPVDVETLDIKTATLTGLGVTATATGALEIAGDASTPDGEIALEIVGALALIDSLAAAGVVPPQQAQAYKSMAEALGRRGDEPDQLLADIVMSDGEMSVNGQRLR